MISTTKLSWAVIAMYYAEQLARLEDQDDWGIKSPSILDQIQTEYRMGNLTEAERDAMRQHVKDWLGDPDKVDELYVEYRSVDDYARYACGVWAGSTGPMGRDEHAIILMAVTLLTEESL
jgi:hypothetical protein